MAKARSFNPRRLDVQAFAAEGGRLEGTWLTGELPRLAEDGMGQGPEGAPEVRWQAQGVQETVKGSSPQPWLQLKVQAQVARTCQRCLQAVWIPLDLDRRFLFVADEAQAEALDAQSEDDVLALTRSLDLRELVEDELLLALPIVPMHESCPQPLTGVVAAHQKEHEGEGVQDVQEAQDVHKPFAALAALKRSSS